MDDGRLRQWASSGGGEREAYSDDVPVLEIHLRWGRLEIPYGPGCVPNPNAMESRQRGINLASGLSINMGDPVKVVALLFLEKMSTQYQCEEGVERERFCSVWSAYTTISNLSMF